MKGGFKEKMSHRRNSVFGILGFAIPTVIIVVVYRVLIDSLGETGFGIYLVASSVGGAVALMDLGIASANIKFISEDVAKGDRSSVASVIKTSALFYGLIGVIIVLAVYFSSSWLKNVLEIPEEYGGITKILFLVAAIQMALSCLANVYISALKAFNRFDIAVIVLVVIPTISFGGGALGVSQGWFGLVGLMITGALGNATGLVVSMVLTHYLCISRGIHLKHGRASWMTFVRMFKFSSVITFHGLAALFFNQVQRLLISGVLGPAAVSIFQFPYIALSKLHALINSGSEFAYPAASATREYQILRSLYLKLLLRTFLVAFLGLLCFNVFSEQIFILWLGGSVAEKVVPLVPVLSIAFLFVALSVPSYYILNGLGMPLWNVLYSLSNVGFYMIAYILMRNDQMSLFDFSLVFAISNTITGCTFQALMELYLWPKIRGYLS